MEPSESLKHLVLIGSLLMETAAVIVVKRRKVNLAMSVSEHAGQSHRVFVAFGVVTTVFVGLMYLFITYWFVPTFRPPAPFYAILVIALFCQLVAGWLRQTDRTRKNELAHSVFAYTTAGALPVLIGIITFFEQLPPLVRAIEGAIAVYMVVSMILYATRPRMKQNYLVYQWLYITFFLLGLILATYST